MSEPSTPMGTPRRPTPDPGWRDRVESLVHRAGVDVSPARVAIAVVAVVAAVVGGLLVLRPSSSAPPPDETLPLASAAPESSAALAPAGSGSPTTVDHLVVQAAGAVLHPGVYEVPKDARVNDLVQTAGGFASDADPDQVELAATLSDGERVYVPRVGESPLPASASSGSASTGTNGPLDLNRASTTDLEALPGIGPALAQAIVDYRSQHGAFHSVEDLARVRGIGPAKMEQLRPLVKV